MKGPSEGWRSRRIQAPLLVAAMCLGATAGCVLFVSRVIRDIHGQKDLLLFVLLVGLVFTVLLTGVTWSESRSRARAERATRALHLSKERLLEHARAKDEFLAMLGHELRNPLAPVRMALPLLGSPSASDGDKARALAILSRQVEHMTRLVEDLLDVARITSGRVNVERSLIRLQDVVERAVETAAPLIAARDHELQVRLPGEPIHVLGDAVRLSQVLANLLHNSAKYTAPGGHVWIEVTPGPAQVTVAVRDDGRGFPPGVLPRLFELFVQHEPDPDRSLGGLGVGLTLVRAIVNLHDGMVTARSDGPGRGAEFLVTLPAAPPPLPARVTPGAPAWAVVVEEPRPRPLKILVVDDNQDAAETLALVLREGHHQVTVTHDGPRALEAAEAQRPELVLLDIGLPGMNGHQVAQHLRERLGGATRIVAVTGYGQLEDRARSQASGFDAHLLKPLDRDDLEALLATCATAW